MTPYFVSRGGVLYTMIVTGGGFLPPLSSAQGGMVLDEIDTCINIQQIETVALLESKSFNN